MLTFGTKRQRPYRWRVRWSDGGKSWISSQIFLPPPSTQTKVLSLSFCFSVLLFFLQCRSVLGFYVVFFFFLFNKRFWVFLRLSQNDASVFLIKNCMRESESSNALSEILKNVWKRMSPKTPYDFLRLNFIRVIFLDRLFS